MWWVKVQPSNFSNWYEVRVNGRLADNANTKAEADRLAEAIRNKSKTRRKYGKVVR